MIKISTYFVFQAYAQSKMVITHLTFTCSKSKIEKLEKDMEDVKRPIKTSERRRRRRCGVFIDNFDHILHLFFVFLLLILNK